MNFKNDNLVADWWLVAVSFLPTYAARWRGKESLLLAIKQNNIQAGV